MDSAAFWRTRHRELQNGPDDPGPVGVPHLEILQTNLWSLISYYVLPYHIIHLEQNMDTGLFMINIVNLAKLVPLVAKYHRSHQSHANDPPSTILTLPTSPCTYIWMCNVLV
jgi:hypothetical protein